MAGATASDAPGSTGPGKGKRTTGMHAGIHHSIPTLAAAAMAERRLSVFRKTLISAATRVSPTQNHISIGTSATREAATFLESAEGNHYRSVMKASARARRIT